VLLRGGPGAAMVNVVGNESPAELSQATGGAASALELTVNLRIEAAPQPLFDVFKECLEAWAEAYHAIILGGTGQCFSPRRPVPTHRMSGTLF
jgi:hypothetical protein